jgi:hypothetical protein
MLKFTYFLLAPRIFSILNNEVRPRWLVTKGQFLNNPQNITGQICDIFSVLQPRESNEPTAAVPVLHPYRQKNVNQIELNCNMQGL